MRFALSEDQKMLAGTLGDMLAGTAPLERVREAAGGDEAVRAALQSELDEMGLAGVTVAEDAGGLGLGVLEAALLQEQLGRHVSPAAFTVRAALAGALCGEPFGAGIASGEVRFGAALAELGGARPGAGVAAGADGRLSGRALFALELADATHLLVADKSGTLHVVETGAPGLAMTAMANIDHTRGLYDVEFDGVPAEMLADTSAGQRAVTLLRVLFAADTLGAAQAMLDKAVAYAKEREQFGRVIGSFQAVKHMCAEMAAELEPARALVWQAAHAIDEADADADLLACLAKAHLAEIGTFIARTATEVHGGMGFTDLLGLHYWFKRIGFNRQMLGGPERHRAAAAKLQGWA